MKYRTIVCDPPWHYDRIGGIYPWRQGTPSGKALPLAYPTMTVDEIAALPVGDLAEPDAHLYLWTTNRYLEDAYRVARAWGFNPPGTLLIWCKRPRGFGVGGAFMSTAEFVLFCRRGSLPAQTRITSQWFEWPRGAHSAKPEAFTDMVEQVSPPPYVELFARRQRLGWATWGRECFNTATMESAV